LFAEQRVAGGEIGRDIQRIGHVLTIARRPKSALANALIFANSANIFSPSRCGARRGV
jgi:hypothetical protein